MSCEALYDAAMDGRLCPLDVRLLAIFLRPRDFTPTRKQIAEWAGCAASSVPRSARKLESLGYLKRSLQDDAGGGKPTGYIAQDTGGVCHDTPPYPPGYAPTSWDKVTAQLTTCRPVSTDTPPYPPPPKEIIKTPQELNPETLELGGSVAAAQPRATAAQRIVTAVGSPFLDPHKSPGLVTRGAIVAGWEASGIDLDAVAIPTIAAICEREAKPIGSWRYFDAAVRQAAADSQPTPITVEAFDGQRPQPYARAAGGRPRSVLAAMASDLSRFSGK